MSSEVAGLVDQALHANYADGPPPGLQESLNRYVEALLLANRGINLVSRKDTQQHVGRFLGECLFLARILAAEPQKAGQLLDLGSGGGFPGLVLKLALPGLQVTLVEATLKKARFLAQVCNQLDLEGIQVLWARAEALSGRGSPQLRRDLRHACDWVTAKGMGTLRASLDLAAPFLGPQGVLWTFKGSGYREELARCRKRMSQLRFQLHRVERLPGARASYVIALRHRPAPHVSRETSAPT